MSQNADSTKGAAQQRSTAHFGTITVETTTKISSPNANNTESGDGKGGNSFLSDLRPTLAGVFSDDKKIASEKGSK